jgi:integrase
MFDYGYGHGESEMRKVEKALSPRRVATLTKPGMHCDGGGLYLQVKATKNGRGFNRSWVFRYMVDGRTRDMGLGSLTTIGLAEARERSRALRIKRLDGVDPLEERRAARAKPAVRVMTFDEAASAFLAEREGLWRNERHRRQWYSTLRDYVSPTIGQLAVNQVETKHVTAVLDPLWFSRPETGSRVRGRIESVLDWAKLRGHRDGENPARWKGHLDDAYPSPGKALQAIRDETGRPANHPAIDYAELPGFMTALRARTGSSARALEFAILTCGRTNEILGARWDELDLDGKVWTVPADRMKGKRLHRVPLSDPALAIINEMASVRQSEFIFAGNKPKAPLGPMALYQMLQKLKRGITVHGCRATFRTWAAEMTSFSSDVIEGCLAHVVRNKVLVAYQRSDRLELRRAVMQAWADHCARPHTDAKVVPLIKQKSSRPAR